MKRQDILEIIVSNPKAIFDNANSEAGKFSEYPRQFQVVRMSHDKSYVVVKRVSASTEEWVLTEDGNDYAKDENGKWIPDTRPVAERTTIIYGDDKAMPTRLVLKSDMTEQGMIDKLVSAKEQHARETAEREEKYLIAEANIAELKTVLVAVGLMNEAEAESSTRWNRVSLDIRDEKVALLTSLLKSALAEVGV
jgi:hypothetical protein